MTETGILMGLPSSRGSGALGASTVVLVVLLAGFLVVLLACLKERLDSRARSCSCSRVWLWAWGFVLLINLPIPLIFGSDVTKGIGAFGMLAGIAVVWLMGHFAVAHVCTIRMPLLVGGLCVAVSQGFPVAHIVAGMLALDTVAGGIDGAQSVPVVFAVTLLTAALLAVAALMIGFAFHATVYTIKKLARRNQ